ncbi:MAG: hypothetical protein JSS09_00245, partial [Verrucomicrobia bacterium]|nr:hypothetical protein [Verrucomicrobiota bacterium]
MKYFLAAISLLGITIPAISQGCDPSKNYSFYIKVDSGISFSDLANVTAPNPPWNPAVQGYNSTLGNTPIIGFSVGCEVLQAIDLEV